MNVKWVIKIFNDFGKFKFGANGFYSKANDIEDFYETFLDCFLIEVTILNYTFNFFFMNRFLL